MKILCLTSHNLDGPDYGGTLRGRNLFQILERFGEVQVVLAGSHKFWGDDIKSPFGGFELANAIHFQPTPKHSVFDRLRHEFDPRFLNTNWIQARTQDREWLQAIMARHDLVWIHGLNAANGFGIWRWPNSVLDIDDIPSSFYRSTLAQASGIFEKLRCHRQIFLWQRHEKTLKERFDAICLCSDPDRKKFGDSDQIFAVPNGFTIPKKSPIRYPSSPPKIGFVGTFKYQPNRDGVQWFVECVWPLVLEKMPRARLELVGDESKKGNWQIHPHIDALGWVADMESEMATWSFAIVPIFVGGGTRIKIVEAFSRKCPVVSTSLGAYGYDVTDGREILIADTAGEFAAKCLRLLANPAEGQALAENAWQKFLKNWTWDAQTDRMTKVIEKVLKQSPNNSDN
jgi:glycosyltransferase involved in cell wall biosynthesis